MASGLHKCIVSARLKGNLEMGETKMATKKAPKAIKKGKKLGKVKPLMATRALKNVSPLTRVI